MSNTLEFRRKLESLINECSMENESDTPDFILCEFLIDLLTAFDKAVNARKKWYGRTPPTWKPGDKWESVEPLLEELGIDAE